MNRFVISVLAPDRVGLLRDITGVVFRSQGNIDQIRQSIVGGFFNLVFLSNHPDGIVGDTLAGELRQILGAGVAVAVLPGTGGVEAGPVEGEIFVVTTRGPDKPGTVHAISSFFVDNGVNIEDWGVSEEQGEILYTARVCIPAGADFRALQKKFKERFAELGLEAGLYHENIIRATNEIGPIKALTR